MTNINQKWVDYKDIIVSFYKDTWLFLSLIVLSLFFSLYTIKTTEPKFVSTIIFELSSTETERLESPAIGIIPFMIDEGQAETEIAPRIFGNEFLSSFMISKKNEIDIQCSYEKAKPRFFSLTSILEILNIFRTTDPSESQIKELELDCLRSMISLKPYLHEGATTKAVSILVEHKNPTTAAKIANELVKYFLLFQKEERRQRYIEKISYLSKEVADAELAVEKIRKKLDRFILQGADSTGAQTLSSLVADQIKEIRNLENRKESIENALLLLEEFLQNNETEKNFAIPQYSLPAYSKSFVAAINKLESSQEENLDKTSLQKIIENEKNILEGLLASIELGKKSRKEKAAQYLLKEKTLADMEAEISSKAFYAQGLQKSLETAILEEGAKSLVKDLIYSKATPAIYPSSPKLFLIVSLNLIISIFVAAAISVAKLLLSKTIFRADQLGRGSNLRVIQIRKNSFSYFKRGFSSKKQDLSMKSIAFLNSIWDKGEVGCLVDISSGLFADKNLAYNASKFVANFAEDRKKTMLVVQDEKHSEDFDGLHFTTNFKSGINRKTKQLAESNVTNETLNYSSLDEVRDFFTRKDYKKFDRTLISVDNSITKENVYTLLKNCDFFLLLGFSGKFNYDIFLEYIDDLENIKERFAGFIFVK